MTSILLEDKNIKHFEDALHALYQIASSILILSCANNHFTKAQLDPILRASPIPIVGGIFPDIIFQNRRLEEGTILLGLHQAFETTILHDISIPKDYDYVIEKEMGTLSEEIQTMFLFFDGTSRHIDIIVQSLFNNYGLSLNYIGASAGNKEFQQVPMLFSNEGLLEDAAIFATTTVESTVGVKHGWSALSDEALQVTKAQGNIIYEIDYKDAFEVYKEAIERDSDICFTKDYSDKAFFNISKSFPLGITRLSGDSVVRVANHTDGKSLVCSGDVLQNAYIQILHAPQHETLIDAAKTASTLTLNNDYHSSFKLYFGCLIRPFVLKEAYQKELDAIYHDDELLIGAITWGEIANNQDHYLELYNATAVVAKVQDD